MMRFRGLTAALAALCLFVVLIASPRPLEAQTAATYQLTDSANVVHQVHGFQCLSALLCLAQVPIDFTGSPFGVSGNPFYVEFPSAQHFICDSGCGGGGGGGLSVAFGGAIGANGTPGGFKDSSGNFQANLGDVTNGQWVLIKNSSLGVTGTFWPYTLGQQVAGSSVPVVLTAAQLATLTPPAAITGYALETGGNLAQIVTDFGAPGATACTTDTASCSQNQQLQRLAQRLTSIVTALGSPFQAGGSIGNTSFGISGTLPGFTSPPTFNLGTLNGAALAANQTGGNAKTQIVDGAGNVIGSTSNNLDVQCANCSGSGVSTADGASFTAGSSLFAGSGGIVQTTVTSNPVTAGDQGMFQMTPNRALFTNLRNSSGAEIGTAASPLVNAGPTVVGQPAANPPVLMGGTANATATGNVQVAKVDSNGTQFIDCSSPTNTLCGSLNTPPLPLTNANVPSGYALAKGTTAAMTGTTSTQIIAPVTGKVIYPLRVACKGDPANAVGTKVQIQDGSGGTVLDTLTVAANGGGEQATSSMPLFWTTSGNGLNAQNVTTGASVICTANGYSG